VKKVEAAGGSVTVADGEESGEWEEE